MAVDPVAELGEPKATILRAIRSRQPVTRQALLDGPLRLVAELDRHLRELVADGWIVASNRRWSVRARK